MSAVKDSLSQLREVYREQLDQVETVYHYEDVSSRVHKYLDPKGVQALYMPDGKDPYGGVDPALGAAMLELICDWGWVKRRVESVRIVDSEHTERQLSLDVQLPYHPKLTYGGMPESEEKPPRQVMLPLSFLRKGMLVNFSVRDIGGNSLPSLGFYDNGALTYHALGFLAQQLELAESLEAIRPEVATRLGINEKGPESPEKDKLKWSRIINHAIFQIIVSDSYDRNAVSGVVIERAQETHRRDLFDTLASSAGALRPREEAVAAPDEVVDDATIDIPLSYWARGASFADTPDLHGKLKSGEISATKTPRVLDSSIAVHLLALGLLHATLVAAEQNDATALQGIELFCSLLSVVSTSYLAAVAMDTEALWGAEEPLPGELSRRTIVKMQCNVEINDRDSAEQLDSRWKKFRRWFRELLRSDLNVLVRATTRSASSTHLEFVFPSGVRVEEISAYEAPSSKLIFESYQRERPFVETLRFPRRPVPGEDGEVSEKVGRRRPVPGEDGEASEKVARRRPVSGHPGSYRASLDRVHVQPKTGRAGLEVFDFHLVPQRMAQPWLAVITTAFAVLVAGLILWRQDVGLEVGDDRWYTFAEFLASITLLTALYGAFYITGNQHLVLRRAFRLPQRIIVWSGLLGMLATMLPLFGMWQSEAAAGEIPLARFRWLMFGLVAGFSGLVGYAASRFWRVTEMDFDQLYEERGIKVKESTQLHDRNVVAVTETGPFDLDYLASALRDDKDFSHERWEELAKWGVSIARKVHDHD